MGRFTLADIEGALLILGGGAVVNWHRLSFGTREEIQAFLRTNEHDLDRAEDETRIRTLIHESTEYIRRTFGYEFPSEITSPTTVEDLFLLCSSRDAYQKLACMTLKVVHVLNHLQAQELRYLLPISDQTLFSIAEQKVTSCVDALISNGVPVFEYKASRKTADSLLTKVLSKRRTTAEPIFDKLRFRIVTERHQDLVPALFFLLRRLLPFNYVIAEESRNDIVPPDQILNAAPNLIGRIATIQSGLPFDSARHPAFAFQKKSQSNPFSSSDYRVINFVIDLPIRVASLLRDLGPKAPQHLGRIVFVMVEFQIYDRLTYQNNELGTASHQVYKNRQRQIVLQRLVRSMPVYLHQNELPPEVGETNSHTVVESELSSATSTDLP